MNLDESCIPSTNKVQTIVGKSALPWWIPTLLVFFTIITPAQLIADDKLDFNRDIRPILSDNCFLCHGPAASTRAAELRLDKRDPAIASNAILPGKADQSELVERIFSDDSDAIMPPPDSNK
jgi:hypothetical protein